MVGLAPSDRSRQSASVVTVAATKVLLINQEKVPHYRVPVYNYLTNYLSRHGFDLTVASEGVEPGNKQPVGYKDAQTRLTFPNVTKLIATLDPEVVIYWVRLRYAYLFPMLGVLKARGKKAIYWGHGLDLINRRALLLKKLANAIEYSISDALILYGQHQTRHVPRRFHKKTFIANNTLCVNPEALRDVDAAGILARHGIRTRKNIICVGRMQRRKRIGDLLAAFKMLNDPAVGLVLVGPDIDGVLNEVEGPNVYKLGAMYGDDRLQLMAASDVFCIPGAVGLSIVDAFQCGLPLVTQSGYESPEMMYLKDGVNGFITPQGDIEALAAKLRLLLENENLREQFSLAALEEVRTNAHIDRMCEGFLNALVHVTGKVCT
jgi:glycosyltransferase involved in cell wall biosynthesis